MNIPFLKWDEDLGYVSSEKSSRPDPRLRFTSTDYQRLHLKLMNNLPTNFKKTTTFHSLHYSTNILFLNSSINQY